MKGPSITWVTAPEPKRSSVWSGVRPVLTDTDRVQILSETIRDALMQMPQTAATYDARRALIQGLRDTL